MLKLTHTDRIMCQRSSAEGVVNEVGRQDKKWGTQSHPNGTGVGHRVDSSNYREWCQRADREGFLTWKHILLEEVYEALAEEDTDALIEELTQVAAVCVNWITDLRLKRDFG